MKHLLKWLGGIAVGLLLLAFIIPLFFEKEIGKQALKALREQLDTELSVEKVSLSLWREFPFASVDLQEVTLEGKGEGMLLKADRLAGRISYWDLLFADDWIVNTIKLDGGELFVYRGSDRVGNWNVLRSQEKTGTANEFSFALSRILLSEVTVRYEDIPAQSKGSFYVQDGELAGAFGNEAYTLTGAFKGQSYFLTIGELSYMEAMDISAKLELDIDPKANTYLFGPTTVTMDDMPIDLSGSIGFVKSSTAYNLDLKTKEGKLGTLLRVLPKQWVTQSIRELDSKGEFALEGKIQGMLDKYKSPAIDFTGELRDGALYIPALKRNATDVSFNLSYSNGKAHSMADSKLQLVNLVAHLKGQPLNGRFTWTNFSDPKYDVEASGTLPLSWLDEIWDGGNFEGTLTARKFRLRGRQRHLVDSRYARNITTSGQFELDRASMSYNGSKVGFGASSIALKGANFKVNKGQLTGFGDKLNTTLTVDNLIPYLLGDDSQTLSFNGDIATDKIDLAAWVAMFGSSEKGLASKGTADLSSNPTIADGLGAKLKLKADQVVYNEVRVKNFTGSCALKASDLSLSGEGFAMEGHWEVEGNMQLREAPSLSAKLACSEVNITELFERTENVGQQVVEARHINGQMTTRAFLEASWDKEANLLMDELHVWANVGMTDGELRDFEMLMAMSKFIRKDDLAHIRFIDVENWIEIDKSVVYLPAMFIQSTASNFTVAGSHGFDQEIDYSIRTNGAQTVMNKLFGKRPGMQFVPDKRNGLNVGFKIDGTLANDNYDVRFANGEVRRDFTFSQGRKAAIRRKLIGLFGPESLIDDYDDDGYRTKNRPSQSKIEDVESRPNIADAAPKANTSRRTQSRAIVSQPARTIDVDTDEYLDWDDEGDDEFLETTTTSPALSGSSKIIDRSDKVVVKPTLKKPSIKLDGLFGPNKAPGEFEPKEEESEFLEGFDTIEPPDQH
ncbi:MAG: AsmA family protein [Saprospiraceae bacterium]